MPQSLHPCFAVCSLHVLQQKIRAALAALSAQQLVITQLRWYCPGMSRPKYILQLPVLPFLWTCTCCGAGGLSPACAGQAPPGPPCPPGAFAKAPAPEGGGGCLCQGPSAPGRPAALGARPSTRSVAWAILINKHIIVAYIIQP